MYFFTVIEKTTAKQLKSKLLMCSVQGKHLFIDRIKHTINSTYSTVHVQYKVTKLSRSTAEGAVI